MSILAQQLYGGVLATDETAVAAREERRPFGNTASKEGTENPLFSGFTYARDTEASDAFGNDADGVKNSPTDIRTAEDTITFFNTTTYGTPGSFARLSKATSTVLTNLARFVKNGDSSETATEWTNSEMKTSFVQDGSGTRMQLVRGEYDNDSGWKNDLGAGTDPNTFNAAANRQYSKANVIVGDLNAEVTFSAQLSVADFNKDGKVDFSDFFVFADEFGKGTNLSGEDLGEALGG